MTCLDCDLALIATIPVADRLCIDTDHYDTGCVDALGKVPIEILGPVIGERAFVLDQRSGAFDSYKQRGTAEHTDGTGIAKRDVRIGTQVSNLSRVLVGEKVAVALVFYIAVVAHRAGCQGAIG